MTGQAITFDFHNTLVHCDEWFELEIRTLPSAFLHWLSQSEGRSAHSVSSATLERSYRRLRTAIIGHGHELSAERSLSIVLARAGIDVAEELIELGVRELMSAALSRATAVPGAVETVKSLSDRNVLLGVVSSAVYHPFLEWALERIAIRERFTVIVTSAGSGYYKSRPEIYWSALAAMGAAPSRSVHVGDSFRFDVEGATRAGMRTVWLKHETADHHASSPDLTVETLTGSSPLLIDLLTRPAL